MSTDYLIAYSTVDSKDKAKEIATMLVKEKLAACVNILPQMESVYFWQDQLEESAECVLLIKTHQRVKTKLKEKLQEIHPYDCPCLVFLPIQDCLPPYLSWLNENISSS